LRHGGNGNEKSAGDFFGGETTEFAKGESNLGFLGDGRVAAGEQKTEAIVRDFGIVVIWLLGNLLRVGLAFTLSFKPGLTAEAINGFVAGGLNDPGAGKFRDARNGPLLDGG
jgi:hypothetical protein